MKKKLVFPRRGSIFLVLLLGLFSGCGGGGDGGDLSKVTANDTTPSTPTPAAAAPAQTTTTPPALTPVAATPAAGGSTSTPEAVTPGTGSASAPASTPVAATPAAAATPVVAPAQTTTTTPASTTVAVAPATGGSTSTSGVVTPTAGSASASTPVAATPAAAATPVVAPAQTTTTTTTPAPTSVAATPTTGGSTSTPVAVTPGTGSASASASTPVVTTLAAAATPVVAPAQTTTTTPASTPVALTPPPVMVQLPVPVMGGSIQVVAGPVSSTPQPASAAPSRAAGMGLAPVNPGARMKVSNNTPSTGAMGASANSAIVLNFSGEMNSADINSSTFTVHNGVSNVPGTVTYSGRTATFTPDQNLGLRTVNTVTLAGSVRDIAGNSLSAPFVYSFTTGDYPDNTPPTVTSTSPMSDAVGVFSNRFIAINFSEPMNESDIISNTLSVTKVSDGSRVFGVVSYSGLTAAFTPASELAPDTSYTVALDASVRDLAGNKIAGNGSDGSYTYSFTNGNARDTGRPFVRGKSPAANTLFVSTDVELMLTFSEVMIASDISSKTFRLKKESDGTYISGAVSYKRLKGTFTPDSELEKGTSYIVTLSCGVQDLASNLFGVKNSNGDVVDCIEFSYAFRTAPDETAPSIIASAPSGFATGIYVNSPIILDFSEEMNIADINTGNISVSSGMGEVLGSLSYSGRRAVFTPDADLAHDTEYTVVVSMEIRDLAGLATGADNRIIFTTASVGYVDHLASLPDTGQVTSYTNSSGEDSDYTLSSPSYTDNGNGTVTDNVTGLMWQQSDDSILRNWSESISYCSASSLGGHTDWRLPAIFEIESITSSDSYNPSINSAYFLNTKSYRYWAYTTSASPTSLAWNVYFTNGLVDLDFKANDYYARCVRGL